MTDADKKGRTGICGYDADNILVRGRNLVTDIMGSYGFTEFMLLQALGEEPTKTQVQILERMV